MKKASILLIVITIMLMFIEPSLVYASEEEVTVAAGNMTIRELSDEEKDALSGMILETIGDNANLSLAIESSYTAYEYSRSFDFYLNDRWVAQANAVCTVWHYTDGKVHLYYRTITAERLASYDVGRTYGSIVNTDGSLSYTTGDRIHLYGLTNTWDFAIDFRVTPTEASFDCYEV